MLTMYDLDQCVLEALRAGAVGFLLKTTPPAELTASLRAAANGRHVFDESVASRLVENFVGSGGGSAPSHPGIDALTEREIEVYRARAQGLSNAEIADSLYLSEATVKTYVTRILAKLQVRDRVQAVIIAFESGLLR